MARFRPVPVEGLPVFSGGAVGFLGYDMVRFFEPTVAAPVDDASAFSRYGVLSSPRPSSSSTTASASSSSSPTSAPTTSPTPRPPMPPPANASTASSRPCAAPGPPCPSPSWPSRPRPPCGATPPATNTRDGPEGQEYILAGDIFQVVPSQRFENEYTGRPIDLYRALRHVNPSPYMFCSSSATSSPSSAAPPRSTCRPSRAASASAPSPAPAGEARPPRKTKPSPGNSLPIQGTCRARHARRPRPQRRGSRRRIRLRRVSEFMIVSATATSCTSSPTSAAASAPDRAPTTSCAPPSPPAPSAAVPKVRAMQIINELEKSKRGATPGPSDTSASTANHDSCIALRTVVLKDGKAYVQAGAGVVADSVPAANTRRPSTKPKACSEPSNAPSFSRVKSASVVRCPLSLVRTSDL